jgi:NTP pyrophosphatase (non-canonical NTP hydrolase)
MKDLQELLSRLRKVSDIRIENYKKNSDGKSWPVTDQIAHAHSELSEVFDVWRRPDRYPDPRESMLEEIVDTVFSALVITNLPEVNIQDDKILEAFEKTMQKIESRVGLR